MFRLEFTIRYYKFTECIFIIFLFPVDTCNTLLSRDLKRNLFNLFASWTGQYSKALGISSNVIANSVNIEEEKLLFSALQVKSHIYFFFYKNCIIQFLSLGNVSTFVLWCMFWYTKFVRRWKYLLMDWLIINIEWWKGLYFSSSSSFFLLKFDIFFKI